MNKKKKKSLIGLPPSSGSCSPPMGYTQTDALINTHILLSWSLHSDQRLAWSPGAVGMVVLPLPGSDFLLFTQVLPPPPLAPLRVVVQSLSRVWLFVTPWTAARQASLSFTISQSLFRLMSVDSVVSSNHLVLCCPLLLLPSIFASIRGFSNEALCIRWSKYWSFSFSISPSSEYSGLIFFRMDWLDLLSGQNHQFRDACACHVIVHEVFKHLL